MKTFFVSFAFLILLVVAIAGFRGAKSIRPPIEIFSDMVRQPKVKAQVPGLFFADGRAAREPVPGTVPLGYAMPTGGQSENLGAARGFGFGSDYRNTGRMGNQWGTGLPVVATGELLERGRERYSIHCAVCHGATGAGNGIAYQLGLVTVANLQQPRIREMADGEVFNTISHGKNTMVGYGDRILVPDRWAIIAYMRALQKSQGGATISDVPAVERRKLEEAKP